MWAELGVGLALVLVIEGLLPSLSPARFRRVMSTFVQLDDRSIRVAGLSSMIAGAVLLYLLRH